MSRKSRIFAVAATLVALAGQGVWAADDGSSAPAATSHSGGRSSDASEELQEVTVTAQHLKPTWAEHNELVQRSITLVYGIADVDFYEEYPPHWSVPVCPLVTGLAREQGVFVFRRVSDIVRSAGAPLGDEECHPNLFIFVTDHPKELLRTMERRRFLIFGNATSSRIDQFINKSGPVKVWHNIDHGLFFGPVNVVVDRTHLHGISEGQLADYLGMVVLTEIKSTAHLGDAQTILKLFDGPPEAAPDGLSDWDRAFLDILYHPEKSLAVPRSLIGRRIVDELKSVP